MTHLSRSLVGVGGLLVAAFMVGFAPGVVILFAILAFAGAIWAAL